MASKGASSLIKPNVVDHVSKERSLDWSKNELNESGTRCLGQKGRIQTTDCAEFVEMK